MGKPEIEFPQRLAHGDGAASRIVRAALDEPLGGPSEAASWQRLRAPRRALPLRLTFVVAAGIAGALALTSLARGPGLDLTVSAETPMPRKASTPGRVASGTRETPRADSAPPASSARARAETPRAARGPAAASDATRCAELARDAKYAPAAACYDEIARGGSMAAELALYEKARLQSRALGDGAAALVTLDEHSRRFPSGVLATEVGMTRIELLIRLGRMDAALGAIEQGLRGRLGQERQGDLQALRGGLLATRGECPAALTALAAARAAGVHESRLEAGESRCSPAGAPNVESASKTGDAPPSAPEGL